MILIFTGMPCSGKSSALEVVRAAEIPIVVLGDAVREKIYKEGIRKDLREYSTELRKKYGNGVVATLCLDKIKGYLKKNSIVCIDGARCLEEIDVFRENFKEVVVVAVHSSPETRLKRFLKRKRDDDTVTEDGFKKRDAVELGWGVGSVIAMGDFVIINEGSIDELKTSVKQLLKNFKK